VQLQYWLKCAVEDRIVEDREDDNKAEKVRKWKIRRHD
jgi:hypothetical protein